MEVSGGQQQRVAIARALVTEPDLLLADEPTGNLDSTSTTEVLDLLRRFNAERNQTIVLVTHDSRVGEACGRIVAMRDGRIINGGPASQAPDRRCRCLFPPRAERPVRRSNGWRRPPRSRGGLARRGPRAGRAALVLMSSQSPPPGTSALPSDGSSDSATRHPTAHLSVPAGTLALAARNSST